MLALDVDAAKNLAIVLLIGFVLLSLVVGIVIKNITMKLLSMLLMVGLALGVWTQRQTLQDCAEDVRAKAEVGDLSSTTCTFFGRDVDVPGVERNGRDGNGGNEGA